MNKTRKRKLGQILSLDFGSHSIKCVVGQMQNDKLKISNMFSIGIDESQFYNGYILNTGLLKSKLSEALKAKKIRVKDVVVSIESTEIIKRELTIPSVQEEDRLDLITYEIGQYLPIDLEAYIIQYKVIEEKKDAIGNVLVTKVGAMPKKMAEQVYNLLTECGLIPRILDIHSHSLEKFIQWNYKDSELFFKETVAFIDFGHSMLNINLFKEGKLIFDRLVNMGGGEFDKILMSQMGIDMESAEKQKMSVNINEVFGKFEKAKQDVLYSEKPDVKNMVLYNTSYHLDECLEEINKVLKYYISRNAENRIDCLYFYGGSSEFIDFDKYVANKLDLKTEIVKSSGKIEYTIKVYDPVFSKYIHAVGSIC